MGVWGEEPWDNDSAADFFGGLWDGTPIVDRVHEALRSDDGEEVVGALWLCSELTRVYVWPIARLDETLALAVAAADLILSGEDDSDYLDRWEEAGDEGATRVRIQALRDVLAARQSAT